MRGPNRAERCLRWVQRVATSSRRPAAGWPRRLDALWRRLGVGPLALAYELDADVGTFRAWMQGRSTPPTRVAARVGRLERPGAVPPRLRRAVERLDARSGAAAR